MSVDQGFVLERRLKVIRQARTVDGLGDSGRLRYHVTPNATPHEPRIDLQPIANDGGFENESIGLIYDSAPFNGGAISRSCVAVMSPC